MYIVGTTAAVAYVCLYVCLSVDGTKVLHVVHVCMYVGALGRQRRYILLARSRQN
jgi:hypothetical protein